MSGGKKGSAGPVQSRRSATGQFEKAVNMLVRASKGEMDREWAADALLTTNYLDVDQAGNPTTVPGLPSTVTAAKFKEIWGIVPSYFWNSPKAKKMRNDIMYRDDELEESIKKNRLLKKVMQTLDWDSLAASTANDNTRLGEKLAIAEMLSGSGASGGRRGRSRSRSSGRGMSGGARLTRWQRIVKKHAGDMKAAKREYHGTSSSKKKSSGRKRGRGLGRVY